MPELQDEARFAVCVANEGCDDLSAGMLYRVLPDEVAAAGEHLRAVDDSGEDYLYPASRPVIVAVPPADIPGVMDVAPVKSS